MVWFLGGGRRRVGFWIGLGWWLTDRLVLDPDGEFIEAIGRQHSAESAAEIILGHMSDWRDGKRLV